MATVIEGPVFVVGDNIDTDQIIPAEYLNLVPTIPEEYHRLGSCAFAGLPERSSPFIAEGGRTRYRIIIAAKNFGCGSSREHAPWALAGWGIRAVVGTSFADIFRNNALKNGLLPVIVDASTQKALFELAEENPSAQIEIDLTTQSLTLPDGSTASFPIDPFSKTCLMEGVDQLGYLLKHEVQIAAYERAASS